MNDSLWIGLIGTCNYHHSFYKVGFSFLGQVNVPVGKSLHSVSHNIYGTLDNKFTGVDFRGCLLDLKE